jgi:hypothetical protein
MFADMLRAARELLAVRSPLDAELLVSELLGSWWGKHLDDADIEEIIGEALVEHAAAAGTPAALALLVGVAYLGTSRQAVKAERAALELLDAGVARPGWAERLGTVTPHECYTSRDVYGDKDSVICVFSYGDADSTAGPEKWPAHPRFQEPHRERHALIVVVDHNAGGMVVDAWVTSHPEKLLTYCRREADESPLMCLIELRPSQARALIDRALRVTRSAPAVKDSFGNFHAFVRARVRALPPGARRADPPVARPDRRATLAAQFLASDEAVELSDLSAASRCVDRIIDYGCDEDFGRPLRVSPAKCERLLLEWIPRKVMLSAAEQEAMPHVLAAWVRWATRRSGLPAEAVRATLDKVWDLTAEFATAYRDPTSFGIDSDLIDRLLPDGDLEALARRAFAFPFLTGEQETLNPADPVDRRMLVEYEHRGLDDASHVTAHLRLAVRLWDGTPPQLWDVAQYLLDRGVDRHDILHRLMAVVESAGRDPAKLRSALNAVRRDLPPTSPSHP